MSYEKESTDELTFISVTLNLIFDSFIIIN